MSAGAFSHEVRRAVDAGAKVVVIDSLNGYLNAMPEERFLTSHLHEMFAYLNQKGVTTVLIVAQHGLMVSGGSPSEIDVSYLADTALLLKKRTGKHERSIRQLVFKRMA